MIFLFPVGARFLALCLVDGVEVDIEDVAAVQRTFLPGQCLTFCWLYFILFPFLILSYKFMHNFILISTKSFVNNNVHSVFIQPVSQNLLLILICTLA